MHVCTDLHTYVGCVYRIALRVKFNKKELLLEINKNLKFKKGVGIAIKSKETSSKLAI